MEELMENHPMGRKIRIIDALNASLAQGILAIYASEMRDRGMEIDEVYDILKTYPAKMNGVFTVGDLKYLAKTGRLSGSAAFVGNILNIKPILRGNKENQIIGIAHADAYEDSLYVMEEIKKRLKLRGFINTSYDYCTGSHVGPDTIALFFMAKDRELGA